MEITYTFQFEYIGLGKLAIKLTIANAPTYTRAKSNQHLELHGQWSSNIGLIDPKIANINKGLPKKNYTYSKHINTKFYFC